MLLTSIIGSLFVAVAMAAPRPVEAVIDAQEQLPSLSGLGGLGGGKLSVCSR